MGGPCPQRPPRRALGLPEGPTLSGVGGAHPLRCKTVIYRVHGMRLASELEIPGIPPAFKSEKADTVFEMLDFGERPVWDHLATKRLVAVCGGQGQRLLELFRSPRYYIINFRDSLEFWVSINGHRVLCFQRRPTSLDLVRQVLTGWVFTLLLALRSVGGLHAGTVAIDGKAIGVAATSGEGKSTLVAALGLAGATVLGDEVLAFQGRSDAIYTMPGCREIRVSLETLRHLETIFTARRASVRPSQDKAAVFFGDEVFDPRWDSMPLDRIYMLERRDPSSGNRVEVSEIGPREAPWALMGCTFITSRFHPEFLNQQFKRICELTARTRILRLSFPRDMNQVPKVVEAVMERGRCPA